MKNKPHSKPNLDLFNDRDPINSSRIHLVFDQSDNQIYLLKSELTPVPQELLDEILKAVTPCENKENSAGVGDRQPTETRGDISKSNSTVTRGYYTKEELKEIVDKTKKNLGHAKFELMKEDAINGFLKMRKDILSRIMSVGVPHFGITKGVEAYLPLDLQDRQAIAYTFVPDALDRGFGPGMTTSEARPKVDGEGETKWIVLVNKDDNSRTSHGGGTFGPVVLGELSRRSRLLEGQDQ